LNPITFAWWYNYNLNQRHRPDSLQVDQVLSWGSIPENELYGDNLEFASTLRMYYSGFRAQAFQLLGVLQFRNSGRSGLYNDILGQWSLQQNQPALALDYFDQSMQTGYLPAMWHRSLALLALGRIEEATAGWRRFGVNNRANTEPKLPELFKFASEETVHWDTLTDQQKLWCLRFKTPELNLSEKYQLQREIQDRKVNQSAEQWLWGQAISEDNTGVINRIADSRSQPESKLQQALLNGDLQNVNHWLTQVDTLNSEWQPWVIYGRALVAEQQGRQSQAHRNYQLLTSDPFFEMGIVEAARYYNSLSEGDFKAYDLLLEAISVNKYSIRLLKAYGKQCARLNLDTYKQTTLETLESLMNGEAYEAYLHELALLEQGADGGFQDFADQEEQ
jgi:hypothetical protein